MTTSNPLVGKAPNALARNGTVQFLLGSLLLIALTLLVAELDGAIGNLFKANGFRNNPLEYPLTAVLIGLLVNFLLRVTRTYEAIRPAIRTEFYLKVGLVLLGARISFGDLLATGVGGLIQALIMVAAVFGFTWWLGGKLKLPDTLRAVMATAVSVCGVSAAIAAAGAVQARKEEVTYITTLVILTALPLMVLMPILAGALQLTPTVAGAWFGGNIDTTAAVVGAGTIFDPKAQEVAAVVKLTQNVLIGFVAFGLAVYFAMVVKKNEDEPRPGLRVIWQRFPKFVLGFALVSLLVSVGLISKDAAKVVDTASKWLFTLSFVCIGLDFSLKDLREAGWRPIAVYMAATVFNTIIALGIAYVIFGVIFPR
ncbi:MAG: putative sulfate exporter family transporter [Chloroflexi bacterium CFX4]|nr:putative sulfate exporter family transporter [Chloroflexi bacterium CFX4]MDL1921353.1 putative sulfate exporter family transporter [Chloroflexi bacterium CFX3]